MFYTTPQFGFSNFLIDPKNITKFNQTPWELELTILFWVCAAGKNAISSARGLDRFVCEAHKKTGLGMCHPFAAIRLLGKRKLPGMLKRSGIGCYRNKANTFWQLANASFKLSEATVDDLETIKGIGLKTSRCFVIHSRQDAQCAGLDVHVLHYLSDLGYDVPKSTPTNKKKYLQIEEQFLKLAKVSGKSVAEYDLSIWNKYREKEWLSKKDYVQSVA